MIVKTTPATRDPISAQNHLLATRSALSMSTSVTGGVGVGVGPAIGESVAMTILPGKAEHATSATISKHAQRLGIKWRRFYRRIVSATMIS
jgi:hypothetical protein